MRMVNISNEKSMQSYTARCSRYKNKYTNLVCGKTAVGRNYNLPRDKGSVTKIKLIKRVMYGRNSFQLLRAKVLLHELLYDKIN
jgi:hypothetical protein